MDVTFDVLFADGVAEKVTITKPSGYDPESLFVLMCVVQEAEKGGRTVDQVNRNYTFQDHGRKESMTRKQIMGEA